MSSARKLRAVEHAPASERKPTRKRASNKPARMPGVLGQARIAFARQNRFAAVLGALGGGAIPVSGFGAAYVAHPMLEALISGQPGVRLDQFIPLCLFVVATLGYSAPTCFSWTRQAFGSAWKAVCWVALLEAGLILGKHAEITWLSWMSLAFLFGINATATACRIALDDAADREASR